MKSGEWKKTVRAALRDLPGGADLWGFSRSLCYRTDRTWTATGVLAEASGVGLGEYLWVVRMPLFVPADVIDLSFSTRLDTVDDEEIRRGPSADSIRAALRAVPSESEALEHIADAADARNVRSLEAAAYATVILGRGDGTAVGLLDQVCDTVPEYPWVEEVVDRADGIRSLLTGGAATTALERLLSWTHKTATALRVTLPNHR
ncbi:hypothetical protein ALI22I_11670 [Saccharothrix sp. ALI-22-I]|uniref:hypothetical protein n=1 Tax=Saccharothrix sp. ALI-22-I TaxID=1933778 RepID=UPI00097C6785|nr:hypothetical protein [Saccharothrix sp. ALI-22-I]ONI90752.1 hypothetical protein ALI22I_11670 [Saccharothrix sp. ALI-22-I]